MNARTLDRGALFLAAGLLLVMLLPGCSSIMRCNEINAARWTSETTTDGLGIRIHTREEWQCMPAQPAPKAAP